jgi:hypothetical protein
MRTYRPLGAVPRFRAMPKAALLLPPLLLLAACSTATGGEGRGTGGLEASWTGSDTGQLAAPVRASWCADDSRLEIFATKEDHGVGLAIYPVDGIAEGEYPAFDPGVDTARPPAVSAAARWYTDAAIMGFQSDSGRLTLARRDSVLSAEFGFRLRSLTGLDTIRLTGRFEKVVPGPCRVDSLPSTPPAD